MMTIGVKYTCPLCGLTKIEVAVPVREPGVEIIAWFEGVMMPALGADHMKRSPRCRPDELHDIMIPTTGRDAVGGPIVN